MKTPLNIKLDKIAHMPTKSHVSDAGYDLYAPYPVTIPALSMTRIDTGVHIYIPRGMSGHIEPRSSMLAKQIITFGRIDAEFTGSIQIFLFNLSETPYIVHTDDRIAQLVIHAIPDTELVPTDVLPDSERGSAGIGSTGR